MNQPPPTLVAPNRSSPGSPVEHSRNAAPYMRRSSRGSGSITTLSYFGASRVVPGYGVMGCAKASLEATARTLAVDLGRSVRRASLSPTRLLLSL